MRQAKLNTPEKRARVGERIKVAATQAGLSLKELAQHSNVSASMIYQYVRGITSIPPELLERIAAVTRVNSSFFDPDKDARSAFALAADQPAVEGQQQDPTQPEPGTRARIQADMSQLHALSEAYEQPRRNRTAYKSSLEQMLALARTIANGRQEGWILWQLATIRLEESDFSGATSQLITAREIFLTEGLTDYRDLAGIHLSDAYVGANRFGDARAVLDDVLSSASPDVLWRAHIGLAVLRFRQYDNIGALRHYCQAAEKIELLDSEQRSYPILILMVGLADVVRAAGHFEEAMELWNRCLQQATVDRKAEVFLESLLEIAQCCQMMGRTSEAKQRLELAVVLAGFLFEDEARLGIARAQLADVLVSMGAIESARESARASMRIANKVRGARPTILAANALAETYLASGQWQDALEYSQESLYEAKRTSRLRELSQIHELRSRAFLRKEEARRAAGDQDDADEALRQAFAEASLAVDVSSGADCVPEQVAAHLCMARCHLRQRDTAGAEREAHTARELTAAGAVSLATLLGEDADMIPALLRSREIDLPRLFASRAMLLPGLEWQAGLIEGTARARQFGAVEGFAAMRDAAAAVNRLLDSLTQSEAGEFRRKNPEVDSVFQSLSQFAVTEATKAEALKLLEGAHWIAGDPDTRPLARIDK